ncbi:MAG: adenylate/guanylate cyclase domain-containing protein [Spirochaetia bacterium]|jgi:class 3 adenylate cyclase/HEAT repeat protein
MANTLGAEAPQLTVEPLLTTHRIFEACDAQKKGLEFLHADLFDSRAQVALSALSAVRALADARSFPHVARLLTSAPEEAQCAAARALGALRHPEALKLLLNLAKTTRSEKLRREALGALAAAAPQDQEVMGLIRQAARTPLGAPGARAHAAGLLLRVEGELALEELLKDGREEILDQVLTAAADNAALASRAAAHCAPLYPRLSLRNRMALVQLAARQPLPESAAILRESLGDPHAEVRRAAYAALGTESHHAAWLSDIIAKLAGAVETNPSLEDEAQQAAARMEKVEGAAEAVLPETRAAVMSRVADLRKQLAAEGRKVSSDAHELGWLIMRSKEYMEYYCDEEFKAALLRWLKGASSDTAAGLQRMLKATAVRVEVRHFDGYSAITDLINNPKRTGIALVARELTLAKTGKSRQFWHLIRVIRLAAIFLSPAANSAVGILLQGIFTWARQEKLYRLAEVALYALAKVDAPAAEAACRECVAVPLASKILAIAALHLLRSLHPQMLEPAATRLLASQDDPYVTLNALEALSAGPPSSSGELAKTLLSRLALSTSREVREAMAAYLGEKILLDITESLKEPALTGDDALRAAALAILERRISLGRVSNRDGTVEFLYRILRSDHEPSRRSAAIMLWKMGDPYAVEVLRDQLSAGSEEGIVDILRRLRGCLREPLASALEPLLSRDSALIQAELRDLLLHEDGQPVRDHALEMALRLRGGAQEEEPLLEDGAPAVELRSERLTFQFERENMQELVMFFSDIVGYSKKAQVLPPMQLSALIQEYEKILLTHVEAHRGELVKRMGDGHMIVFHDPIPAVLAAIRLQKSLRRFNRYRDETTRVVIRIGIHVGKVVRKAQGDVLGNAVNIASRLESSAPHGSILISDLVYEKVKDAVHAREIGHITVKNISEPIRVFEPYEIVIDLPAELDPLKQTRAVPDSAAAPNPEAAPDPAAAGSVTLDRETYVELARCFSALISLCRKAEHGQVALSSITERVLSRWSRLRPRLPGLAPAQQG